MVSAHSVETKAQAAAGDKVKSRLEQLDDIEDGSVKETLNLNQKEYVNKIDTLNKSLVNAWDNDQRVKALKIAIQVSGCSKECDDPLPNISGKGSSLINTQHCLLLVTWIV